MRFPRSFAFLCGLITSLLMASMTQATTMHYLAEDSEGQEITAQLADSSINPASVVKIATSMMALERLGRDYRFTTRLFCSGPCTIEKGVLTGDLILKGGADPDFQAENAWLLSHALEELGITSVSGNLHIQGLFWMGWEHGIRQRETDPARRIRLMGTRLLHAWDSDRWGHTEESSWEDAAPRHGWNPTNRPKIMIKGRIVNNVSTIGAEHPLLVHLSNPLSVILKRFNTFSNNDIIRIAEPLGGAAELQSFVRKLLVGTKGGIRISAASGEGVNRLTPRQVLRLLRAFKSTCEKNHLETSEILPLPGCDPGPTVKMFPRLAEGPQARTAIIKTGTLSTTDGGVAVLTGFFRSFSRGEIVFCVAAPRAGGAIRHWRRQEENWLLELEKKAGGATPFPCGAALPFSDTFARVDMTNLKDNTKENH